MIVEADALDFLRRIPDASVDLVITDPAYESLEKHRKIGTTTRLQSWFPVFPNGRFPKFFHECYRVLRNHRHCYVMCDAETLFVIKPIAEEAGFTFWKPLVWDKGRIGMGYHYRARYEFIAFFEKGKRKLRSLGVPDVLNVPRIKTDYPTEKPVPLLTTLVRQSSHEGELVLDTFAGSGSTAEACLTLNRRFSGCDVSPRAVSAANERLKKLSLI